MINVGTNRSAFKLTLGLSPPLGRWWLEFYAGVWSFTTEMKTLSAV